MCLVCIGFEWRNNSNGTTQISLVDQQTCVINVDSLCLWCIVSGLGFLSLAPHQEARFLIPLLIPIVLVCASFLHQNSTMLEVREILNEKRDEGSSTIKKLDRIASSVMMRSSFGSSGEVKIAENNEMDNESVEVGIEMSETTTH